MGHKPYQRISQLTELPKTPVVNEKLPFKKVNSSQNSNRIKVLAVSSYQQTEVNKELYRDIRERPLALHQRRLSVKERALVELLVNEVLAKTRCLVASVLICGANVILGFEIIKQLDGVMTSKEDGVQ